MLLPARQTKQERLYCFTYSVVDEIYFKRHIASDIAANNVNTRKQQVETMLMPTLLAKCYNHLINPPKFYVI